MIRKIKIEGLFFLAAALLYSGLRLQAGGVYTENVFSVATQQLPQNIRNKNPAQVYLLFSGNLACINRKGFIRNDSVTNYKMFMDSVARCGAVQYRLLFRSGGKIDSAWEMNADFTVTTKAFPARKNFIRIVFFTDNRQTETFHFDYGKKFRERNEAIPSLQELMQSFSMYSYADRVEYATASVWILSIGIDDYEEQKFKNCESDAVAYAQFFTEQYSGLQPFSGDSMVHSFVLLNKQATRDSILKVLGMIAAKASPNDYFIFNFSGVSYLHTLDSVSYSTYFFPYNVVGQRKPENRNKEDKTPVMNNLISLRTLQEYIQLIPCTRQLFISEAGPSGQFKTEFVKTMMQDSPELASLLNVNRVIMVPDGFGLDELENTGKAPITYYITSLDTRYNIYDLFGTNAQAQQITFQLKKAAYEKPVYRDKEYFSVFFERNFLQEYREIFGELKSKKRGLDLGETELKDIKGFSGNRYALIIGTDHYKATDWDKLDNPVYDATEIAAVLKSYYDYSVTLLKDPPMDSFYNAVSTLYKNLKENDQLIIYIAGHGDFDAGLLDDGFIVCADSKSPDIDPLRNSYIQHTKLKKMINKIPARQILVLLDICHGGVFDDAVLGKERNNPASAITNRNVMELLKDKAQYTTRKVLSSVGKESAFDGKAGKHSPFAAYLLKILTARGGTEGIVTLSDIYALLQKASLNETATLKISPHIAGFGDNDPLSEFILIPVSTDK